MTSTDDATQLVLGRLLLVALAAGAVIGGLAPEFLFGWTGTYANGAFFLGALVGMAIALLTASLNAVLLFRLERARTLGIHGRRLALVPLPTIAAAASIAAFSGLGSGRELAICVGVAIASALTAWAFTPWCLPLSRPILH